jgi:hypothetical protein
VTKLKQMMSKSVVVENANSKFHGLVAEITRMNVGRMWWKEEKK